eukprot:CAMPEP_0177789618 /NCGR_PEP_ID=MMETSP0491_2-20121128/22865_1 /TAXON_ID=63592 /ORGANISM="Tetraselmis chuii, Strain PLY429" /LENGTH=74 /DNA_ID=CAMNT_0019311533 /DNA_START=1094 /DNA_END=1319 /DNA_ORIENTATION=-
MAVALQPVSAPVTLAADGQPSIRRRYQPLTQIDARGIDDLENQEGDGNMQTSYTALLRMYGHQESQQEQLLTPV